MVLSLLELRTRFSKGWMQNAKLEEKERDAPVSDRERRSTLEKGVESGLYLSLCEGKTLRSAYESDLKVSSGRTSVLVSSADVCGGEGTRLSVRT